MRLIAFFLLVFQFSLAEIAIDPRYDNYDGETLVFKLIEDNHWPAAEHVFTKEKDTYLKHAPADYYALMALFSENRGNKTESIRYFEKSLLAAYSSLALEKIILLYDEHNQHSDGLALLEKYQKNVLGKNLTSEITFLKTITKNASHLSRVFKWAEYQLAGSFQFPLFKFYVETLIRNKLVHEATIQIETAMDQSKIKSADEALTLTELFLVEGLDKDIHGILERARLKFPNSDLVKLNLAQVLFKKDLHFSALNLLSELKLDDGVLNVQLELMNLMNIKAYSLFHRIHLQDSQNHLKNWFVYFINNEDWSSLYALHPRYQSAPWKNDEFNYAMAYSSQVMDDKKEAWTYIQQIRNPNLSQKKASLIKSLNL